MSTAPDVAAVSVESELEKEPLAIETLPDLPGYILLGGTQLLIPLSDDRAGMSVKVPVNGGRDLNEITFLNGDTGVVMRIGSALYRRV